MVDALNVHDIPTATDVVDSFSNPNPDPDPNPNLNPNPNPIPSPNQVIDSFNRDVREKAVEQLQARYLVIIPSA